MAPCLHGAMILVNVWVSIDLFMRSVYSRRLNYFSERLFGAFLFLSSCVYHLRIRYRCCLQALISIMKEYIKNLARPIRIGYGTAGFRCEDRLLEKIAYRVGLFVGSLSRAEKGATFGVMVTASHNELKDNGIKISEPSGHMLRNSL